jgi:hypothetical protein
MKIKTSGFKIGSMDGKTYLWIELPQNAIKTAYEFINGVADKLHDVEIKVHRERRSLNANNYSWSLSDQLADALRISKEDCHFLMLKRYGQKTIVSVIEEGISILTKAVDYCEKYTESELNGKTFYHFKVWKGSHEFDTKEMAIFIDGIVSECKEVGIETDTPDQIARIKASWGKEK